LKFNNQDGENMKIFGVSTQLYVWSQVKPNESFDNILGEVASAGYDGAETNLMSSLDKAIEIKSSFDKYSLKATSLYSGGNFHEAKSAKATVAEILKNAEFGLKVGSPSITVNPNSKGAEKTDDELKVQAEYLNKLGEGLLALGMGFYIHNHTPEIVSNAREFRSYCDLTDPRFVNLCIDVHWVYRGGVDPFELSEEYGDRIKSMHIRNSKDGIWMEDFGDGDIDYCEYRDLLEKHNYSGWITIELAYEGQTKITRPLVENAKLGREYVRKVFGV
jgi:inosose dehydratase